MVVHQVDNHYDFLMLILLCRWGNPTTDVVAQVITALEGGVGSYVTTTGMYSNVEMSLLFVV